MSKKTDKWISGINAVTQSVKENFYDYSHEQLNYKPDPDTWSIGQNLEHIITLNESYFPALDQLLHGTYSVPFHGRFGFIRNMFGNMIMKYSAPDRKKRSKTMPIWEPTTSKVSDDIVERFEAHQQQLKDYIRRCEPLVEKGASIASPANKNIVYSLEKAIDIIVAHEWRHFAQARQLT